VNSLYIKPTGVSKIVHQHLYSVAFVLVVFIIFFNLNLNVHNLQVDLESVIDLHRVTQYLPMIYKIDWSMLSVNM
jgi:hypothetical protein